MKTLKIKISDSMAELLAMKARERGISITKLVSEALLKEMQTSNAKGNKDDLLSKFFGGI